MQAVVKLVAAAASGAAAVLHVAHQSGSFKALTAQFALFIVKRQHAKLQQQQQAPFVATCCNCCRIKCATLSCGSMSLLLLLL